MNAWSQWFGRQSLAGKMVLVMSLLLLLVQTVGFGVVRQVVERQVQVEVAASLQVAERIWMRQIRQNASRLADAAGVLAADFGFRAAIATADVDTIASALENAGARIGAGVVAFMDPSFRLVSSAQGHDGKAGATFEALAADLARVRSEGRLALVDGTPYLFVIVPVRSPLTVGWVLMGFPLDQAWVDDFQRLSATHAVVLAGGTGSPLGLIVSSWPDAAEQVLDPGGDALWPLTLDGVRVAVRSLDMDTVAGDMRVVLVRPLADVLAPYERLQWLLALVTVGAVLLFAAVSRVAARRVAEPLSQLTRATQGLEQGAFDVEVRGLERGDEVGALARGFDRMRSSIAAQREEILRLAYWDRLTGLPNREQFRQHLMAAIEGSRTVPKPLVVITLNLDRFKHVNDVLGYGFGDELLRAVASRLKALVRREGDMVARMGGDEFAILLARTDMQGAVQLARRIMESFESPLAFDDQTVDLSASMGVACWPDDAADADLLMSRSEIAMYAAKSRTEGVLLYSPALDSSSAQNLSLLSDLRRALQEGQLRLFLQPKLDVATRQVVAAEALVRWEHPQRGLVPPLQFIPFAEQTGFVRQLTLWMFEEAARHWAALQPPAGHLRVAINLSTRDLLDLEFPSRLAGLLERYGLEPGAFCLEITESAIMDDPQRAEATLNRLAAQGFRLSIDDFGTGYSSLAYLKRLPVHELKIDKSFVMGMEHDDSDAKIVRSTVDLAHNLGLAVVAEGVENEAILELLHQLGCDEAQGYHISRPMPVDAFNAWRERRAAAAA